MGIASEYPIYPSLVSEFRRSKPLDFMVPAVSFRRPSKVLKRVISGPRFSDYDLDPGIIDPEER